MPNLSRPADSCPAERQSRPHLWAIGGGKGGVGKSVIAANLAVRLARANHRVALVDVDLGGANLHTMLGMSSPRLTLSDFVAGRVEDLHDVMLNTGFVNLWLVSGAQAMLELANLKHAQKEKLVRHVRCLDVDHVFLDLGSGAAFNVLDFFLAADHGVLVVVPEPTSVENGFQFLKSALFRKIRNARPRGRVRAVLDRVMSSCDEPLTSPMEVMERAAELDEEIGAALRKAAAEFAPGVLINRVTNPAERRLGEEIAMACGDYLDTDVAFLGYVDQDIQVSQSIQQRCPAVQLYPGCSFSRSLEHILRRLLSLAEARHG